MRLARDRPAGLLGKPRLAGELADESTALLALLKLGTRPRADASKVAIDGTALGLAVQVGQTGAADELNATVVTDVLLAGGVRLELSQSRSGNCERLDRVNMACSGK